jgi:hypothetical protein
LNKQHQLEKAIIKILNLDGWKLKWTGEGSESWDAEGLTPKGRECVIEMKFRNKYYPTKMLEKFKYDKLIATGKVAFYFVNDPKANYMFWLNDLKMPEPVDKYCPSTTMWQNNKVMKPCYLLEESQAAMVNTNNTIDIMKKDIIQKLNQLSDSINLQQREELLKDIVQLKLTENYSEFIKIKDKWNI